jgi:hypothetical protein
MSDVFSLRLPAGALRRLRALARKAKTGPTQLARTWILERLEDEAPTRAAEPAIPYGTRARLLLPQDARGEIASICRRRGVRALALFGSGARGDFDPARSDLDFAVEFLDMPIGLRADAYFGLIEDLELLFGRWVDLAELNAGSNPFLREAIEADLVTLYEAA